MLMGKLLIKLGEYETKCMKGGCYSGVELTSYTRAAWVLNVAARLYGFIHTDRFQELALYKWYDVPSIHRTNSFPYRMH